MKKYIIITNEGKTLSPSGKEIKNLQVLGVIDDVSNEDEALKKFLKENTWIWDSGFNVAEFVYYEIL